MDEEVISNSAVLDAEWRQRPINLMSVLRSFVSQLSPGDDMTKMSLPSELCHPFSMLELISYRQLSYFQALFGVNKAQSEEDRFLAALKWLVSLLQSEEMHKKPFNPVIGETHVCWVDNGGKGSDEDWTEFISEQVSHHPPISSFFIRNAKEQIQMEGNLKFGVQFGGNHASVTTAGPVSIRTAKDHFTLDKSIPNMVIQNVVWGTKYVMWDGEITLSCPDTKYSATLDLSEVDPSHNRVEGTVFKDGEPVYQLAGQCGYLVEIWAEGKEDEKKEFFVNEAFKTSSITYPPAPCLVEMDSIKLWKTTSDAIIDNDLYTADTEKIKVETNQRAREKARKEAGLPYDAQFFVNVNSGDDASAHWKVKEGIQVNKAFLEKLREKASAEAAAQAAADAEREANQEPGEGGEGCSLQ